MKQNQYFAENIYAEITEVHLSAFVYRLFHEDFFSLVVWDIYPDMSGTGSSKNITFAKEVIKRIVNTRDFICTRR